MFTMVAGAHIIILSTIHMETIPLLDSHTSTMSLIKMVATIGIIQTLDTTMILLELGYGTLKKLTIPSSVDIFHLTGTCIVIRTMILSTVRSSH